MQVVVAHLTYYVSFTEIASGCDAVRCVGRSTKAHAWIGRCLGGAELPRLQPRPTQISCPFETRTRALTHLPALPYIDTT
jgi:hypothetical protein